METEDLDNRMSWAVAVAILLLMVLAFMVCWSVVGTVRDLDSRVTAIEKRLAK
jgi:hypothetical protein